MKPDREYPVAKATGRRHTFCGLLHSEVLCPSCGQGQFTAGGGECILCGQPFIFSVFQPADKPEDESL